MSDEASLLDSQPAPDAECPGVSVDSPAGGHSVFGYGHPAHRPDPDARYVFQPGPPRTLPLNPRRRWRTAG